ncbi:hypothetical protein EU805_04890 [Salipiger sp. IMCC34102]|uniref:hypothetical protein n=1 Tax=Salipiger sp. IMCC34102 TaxID=2510647 RepID=UPI00101C9F52|nr:hypothetical protein [Salipiger sp. IMCC34102]RYH03073.1 hypothetical protein EU805_04890 [Salipiger sp. IMCC34102]
MRSFSVCALLLTLLCACGDGGLVDDDSRDVIALLRDAERTSERLGDLPGTAFDAMPTSGRATFEGLGGVFIDPVIARDSDDLSIFGDARLDADFRRGTITGRVDNLVGVQGLNPATGERFDVDGTIEIGDRGSRIGAGAPNDARATYTARLATEDRGTFDVRGTANGKFLGTRASEAGTARAPRGLRLQDDDLTARRRGDDRILTGTFDVFGEN